MSEVLDCVKRRLIADFGDSRKTSRSILRLKILRKILGGGDRATYKKK